MQMARVRSLTLDRDTDILEPGKVFEERNDPSPRSIPKSLAGNLCDLSVQSDLVNGL